VEKCQPLPPMMGMLMSKKARLKSAPSQGLTLVHYSAQRKHILWHTLGA